MLEAYSRAWLEIDYDAIEHNVKEIQKLVGDTKIIGIVKANAYGLDDIRCTQALRACGVDFFGVSSIDEALHLRQAGIQDDILILGYTPQEHWHYLFEENIIQTLCGYDYAKKLNAFAQANDVVIRCHCKIDTGMSRLGFIYQDDKKEFDQIVEAYRMERLCVEGIFSHFPSSDDLNEPNASFTKNQIHLFKDLIENLERAHVVVGKRHIQNSYGILNYGDLGLDYCRPGLLYMGVTQDDSIPIASKPDFHPIMSLYANVSLVKEIDSGVTVSYGRHFTATKPTKIATMSIGYADGLPRALSNQGFEVLVHGVRCPIVGNICMDQCMIDVTNVDDVKEGDVVCIVGKQGNEEVTVDEISRAAKTINNETLTRLTARLPRLKKRG